MMQLKQVLKSKQGQPVTLPGTATVATAIQTMSQHRVGSVIMQADSGEPIGILTERDILRLCAEGKTQFDAFLVKDCMTTDIISANPGDTVSDALTTMTSKRFRHMPVVEDGKMVGMVSIGDLVKAKLQETAIEAQALREYITT